MKKILLTAACTLSMLYGSAQNAPLWLRYPAISPDGSAIVFTYKGDVYRVPTAGGAAMPLTLHESQDYMPVWSHDGRQIAFASDRYGNFDVFVMPSLGGAPTRLTYFSANDYPSDFTPDNKEVLFASHRTGAAASAQFPYRRFSDLYTVGVSGGRENLFLQATAELARFDAQGTRVVYQDRPGPENEFRKHHTSSVTRNLWLYDRTKDAHTQLTTFAGEDRNPLLSRDGKTLFFLSETSGTMNVWQAPLDNPTKATPLTRYDKHPVRNLSMADDGTLCFSFDGELYTLKAGGQPSRVNVVLAADSRQNEYVTLPIRDGATEMAVSPNGKEVAFIARGEVFVTSADGSMTKRITNTPEQERSVSFSPDGRTLLYAAERNSSWDLFTAHIKRDNEPYFFGASLIEETPILTTPEETFQPLFSPDGKEVAFLEERTTLRVLTLDSKKVRTVVAGDKNYSYSDGDIVYSWSPDGKWLALEFLQPQQWISEVGVVSAQGGEIRNLTQSGYNDNAPKWAADGSVLLWFSDRDGMRNHASWGSESDVYALFLTQSAYDRFKMSKEEFDILKEKEDKDKEASADKKDKTDKKLPDVVLEDGVENRKARLTVASTLLGDALMSKDGEKLYYLAKGEKGFDVWETNLRTHETKVLQKLGAEGAGMEMDKEGKRLFIFADGRISKITLAENKLEPIAYNTEIRLNVAAERAYMYEHVWRQVTKKFYVKDLHGVDWTFYKTAYAKFLPHIGNGFEFAELLSELLGELNASHTGGYYTPAAPNGDQTASLGVFYDETYRGKGMKIAEVMEKSPLVQAGTKIKAGTIIEKIDGEEMLENTSIYTLLNRKAGKNTLLSLSENGNRWEEVVKPISLGAETELRYQRWVKHEREMVEKRSNGRIGYVHVRGMDNESFRTVYEDALGRHANKAALVVDTRFNGGGWLHDDLATFLNNKPYLKMEPRGQDLGTEPRFRWHRPSAVLMNESNYSDAHMFPYVYKALAIGKLVGMPVAGTATAVWWENLIDPTIRFGIPQVGMRSNDGYLLENTQLEPDIKVFNEPKPLRNGEDQQINAVVDDLLKGIGKK